jgi:hypothetical protein
MPGWTTPARVREEGEVSDLREFEIAVEWVQVNPPAVYKIIARSLDDAQEVARWLFGAEHTTTAVIKETWLKSHSDQFAERGK